MKKIAKIASLLMCLALLIGIAPFNANAASDGYEALDLMNGGYAFYEVGIYMDGNLNGKITEYYETTRPDDLTAIYYCMIDKSLDNSMWSKPIKFTDLYDEGGSWIPAILVHLDIDGKPAKNVAGFRYWVRDLFDCLATHFAIQVATDAAKTQWVTVYEEGGDGEDAAWEDYPATYTFDPVDAYAIRFLAFNISEPKYADDAGLYPTLVGDDTRFVCSEFQVLVYNGSGDSSDPKPTEPEATEPKATEPNATEPTEDPNATEPTEDPNATEPTEDPNATEPTEDPNATEPTEDPNATEPTEDPNATEPTEDPNATEPEATEPANNETQAPTDAPATNNDAKEEPKSNAGLIIGIIAGVLVIAAVVFFVIKKKK